MTFDVKEYLVFIYPVLIGFMIIEYLTAKENYHLKDSLAGFGIALGASIIAIVTKAYAVLVFQLVFDATADLRLQLLGYESLGWSWWVWIICLLGDDFNFYWHHRLSHTVRLLWGAHVPHHSSNNFNLAVSIRNGWFITFYKPVFWMWMPCLGFDPRMVGAALIINAVYQFFLHTQLVKSLGFAGKIFNNPYIHQVHHASNDEYLDKNHGGILMIWDHVFGTYQDVIPEVKPKYGIVKNPDTYNPIRLNTHVFEDIWRDLKKAKSVKEGFMYVFGPPGWSVDGSSLTAKQIQRKMQ